MAPPSDKTNLASILTYSSKPAQPPLLIIQYDLATTPWPLVRHLLTSNKAAHVVILSLRTPRKYLIPTSDDRDIVAFLDWTAEVPGYGNEQEWKDPRQPFLDAIEQAPAGTPLVVLIDSAQTLQSDLGSTSKTVLFLNKVLSAIKARSPSARLVLPLPATSPLLPHVSSSSFSTALTHLTLHSLALVRRICEEYLVTPGGGSKFWTVFAPAAARGEGEKVGWGTGGGSVNEDVVEVLVRSRKVERTLEGWRLRDDGTVEGCKLNDLAGLKSLATGPPQGKVDPSPEADVTRGLPFNLSLTESQAEAKSKVALPYAFHTHETAAQAQAEDAIHYDPDSADDMDDEDPDEDLDL